MKTFTVVGYYPEEPQSYCDLFDCETAEDAVREARKIMGELGIVVAVFEASFPVGAYVMDYDDALKVSP